jgi:hypothetical protein
VMPGFPSLSRGDQDYHIAYLFFFSFGSAGPRGPRSIVASALGDSVRLPEGGGLVRCVGPRGVDAVPASLRVVDAGLLEL